KVQYERKYVNTLIQLVHSLVGSGDSNVNNAVSRQSFLNTVLALQQTQKARIGGDSLSRNNGDSLHLSESEINSVFLQISGNETSIPVGKLTEMIHIMV